MTTRHLNIGLAKWNTSTQVALAAVTADLSICFVGASGTGKTVGAEAMAHAVYGKGCKFRSYYCPELTRDTLVGFMDLAALNKGTLKFIDDGFAVWDYEVVLFDEPTRAPSFIQSYIMEMVRTRKLLGRPTAAKLVFSAVNPPDLDSSATYLPVALSQRYVYAWAPDVEMFVEDHDTRDLQAALYSNLERAEGRPDGNLEYVRNARDLILSGELYSDGLLVEAEMTGALHTVLRTLLTVGRVPYSIRQLKHLRQLLEGLYALHREAPDVEITPESVWSLVHATVPQWYGVVPSDAPLIAGGGPTQPDESSVRIPITDAIMPVFSRHKLIHSTIPRLWGRLQKSKSTTEVENLLVDMTNMARGSSLKQLHNPSTCTALEEMGASPSDTMQHICRIIRTRSYCLRNPQRPLRIADLYDRMQHVSQPPVDTTPRPRIRLLGPNLQAVASNMQTNVVKTCSVGLFLHQDTSNDNNVILHILPRTSGGSSVWLENTALLIFASNAPKSKEVSVVFYGKPFGFTVTYKTDNADHVVSLTREPITSAEDFKSLGLVACSPGAAWIASTDRTLVELVLNPTLEDLTRLNLIEALTKA